MRIEARYRVITPMFCGGADPKVPELRLQSFKGVLRFWWRALAWSRCNGNLEAVREQEDILFGSTSKGQSRILMHLMPTGDWPKSRDSGEVLTLPGSDKTVGEGARYLGYGVMEAFGSSKKKTQTGQLTRGCLPSPLDFTLILRVRNTAEVDRDLLLDSLKVLGTVGALGSKSRKGYGSLVLQTLQVEGEHQWEQSRNPDDLCRKLSKLICCPEAQGLPGYTAFSAGARHVVLSCGGNEPLEILDLVGREMLRYRSWGNRGKILGGRIESERNFKDDHDLMKSTVRKGKHPQRIAFGLPHNYGPRREAQVGPLDRDLDRRASPLFIHIHKCGEESVAILSFLPARFLPKDRSAISVGGNSALLVPEDELYRPIHGFLDRLLDPEERKEPFTDAIEVKCS